jgi:hypothetical protein
VAGQGVSGRGTVRVARAGSRYVLQEQGTSAGTRCKGWRTMQVSVKGRARITDKGVRVQVAGVGHKCPGQVEKGRAQCKWQAVDRQVAGAGHKWQDRVQGGRDIMQVAGSGQASGRGKVRVRVRVQVAGSGYLLQGAG